MAWHAFLLRIQSSVSLFLLFWAAQSLGVLELGAFTVLFRLALIVVFPAQAIGAAAATLVGRAAGSGDAKAANAWLGRALLLSFLTALILSAPLWSAPDAILIGLTGSTALVEIARLPLQIFGFTVLFSSVGFTMATMLSGAGAARTVQRASFYSQWILMIPIAILVGPVMKLGLLALWLTQTASRIAFAGLLARAMIRWRRNGFRLDA
jgi:Na+-driven multidrug efflux pump